MILRRAAAGELEDAAGVLVAAREDGVGAIEEVEEPPGPRKPSRGLRTVRQPGLLQQRERNVAGFFHRQGRDETFQDMEGV